jgi:integrase
MGVQLREKKIKGGKISFYLDIYHNKTRWYETLNIHINQKKLTDEDRDKKRLAQEIRAKRENELIVQDNGLVNKTKKRADYVIWLENHWKEKGFTNNRNTNGMKHLKRYQNGKPLPFGAVTDEWIKAYGKHLLTKVSNNTAFNYLKDLFTSLEEAVRKGIILQNPFRKIPKHERIKLKPIFRNSFTLEELETLWHTPCKMEYQYKQAYLFSCFSGLRWSDVNPLKWSEVVIKMIEGKEEWFIYFEQEKTEDIEYLPLSEQAILLLKERKAEQKKNEDKSLFVFPKILEVDEKNGKVYKRVYYFLKKWAVAAGFDPKRMHFHTGRHTFATNILENSPDADLWTVSKLLGHKSIGPTMIYTHVREGRKKSAVKGLPTLNLKQSPAA